MTRHELRMLVAAHAGSVPSAVVANLDRREEILDAAMLVELDEARHAAATRGSSVRATYVPRSREWFVAEVDRLLQEKQEARIRDLQERSLEAALGEPKSHGDVREPGRIPLRLVEEAVRLHERHGLGRRRLAVEIPGLTEYQAGQILCWYRVGRPAGLWLDEQARLKWSKVISTTAEGVRLPRA